MNEDILLSPVKLSELGNLIEASVRKVFETTHPSKTESKIESDLLDIRQASKFLGLAVPTLYAKVSERTIPHSKRGKKLFFSREQLNDWVKSGQRKTVEQIETEANNFISRKRHPAQKIYRNQIN